MNVTRTAKFDENGKLVYDPPFTEEELARQREEFAAMCQCRRAPMMKGAERTLMEGEVINHGLGDMAPFLQEYYVGKAKAAGINITGKVYRGGLADGRGPADPEAWVGGVDDIMNVAKRRNLNLRGSIERKAIDLPPKPDVPLSNQALGELAVEHLQRNPDWKGTKQDLKEMLVEKHGAPVRKRKKQWTKAQLAKFDATPDVN